jgi:Domain of unknown function (DUF4062)
MERGYRLMDKRYQVFVSSTFTDLQDERSNILQTLMKMDCIPAGMELFPAADEEQFEFIKKVIDDCDYYLLIIGGRYGSTTKEGISYTEKEYDYAVSKNMKVIALIHSNPDAILAGKTDKDLNSRKRLEKFRKKVKTGRLVEFWDNSSNLSGKVALSLVHAMKTYPAIGWVRANQVANADLLNELNELRKRNDELQQALSESYMQQMGLAGLDESITLKLESDDDPSSSDKVVTTWGELFGSLATYLLHAPYVEDVWDRINTIVKSTSVDLESSPLYVITQDFEKIQIHFMALDLIEVTPGSTPEEGRSN